MKATIDHDRVRSMLAQGVSRGVICQRLGCSNAGLQYALRMMGLCGPRKARKP